MMFQKLALLFPKYFTVIANHVVSSTSDITLCMQKRK